MTANAIKVRDETFTMVRAALLQREPAAKLYWEGVPANDAPQSSDTWARMSLLHVVGRQASLAGELGARRWQRTGLVTAQCFAPLNGGSLRRAVELAVVVRDALQGRQSPSCVWYRNPRIMEVGEDRSWYQVNAVIEFDYDELTPPAATNPENPDVQTLYPFPVPLLQWVINHNLGRRVSADAYTTGGVQVWAQVTQPNDTQTIINFDIPQSGYAVLDL